MVPGCVRSEQPEEPDRSDTEDTRSNSLTAAEREALLDDRGHLADQGEQTDEPVPVDAPRKKKRWPTVVAIFAVLAVICGAVASVFAFPVFTVNNVVVEGNNQVDTEQIIDATAVEVGVNLLNVDTNAAARGVVSLPRIREATVSRSLPDALTVTVTERRVVAWTDDGGEPLLIDDTGEPFADGAPPESAVRLDGVDPEDQELLRGAVDLTGALSDEVGAAVDHLSADSESTYTLHLADGRTVFWGLAEDNHNKAIAVEAILSREGGEWDVSNPQLVTQR